MAEKETPKSRRDQFGERLKAKYPDKEYADDEALFGQIDDDYAAYDEEIGKYKEREGKLNALLAMSPSNARFLTDMAKGVDPWIAVIERLGIDGITDLINDPDKQEAYAEANKKYVERLADEERLEEEYRTNLAESLKLLEQLQGEKGLSDETVDAAMDLVLQMANEALVGKFSRETIETALDECGYTNSGIILCEDRLVHYVYKAKDTNGDVIVSDALGLVGTCHIWVNGGDDDDETSNKA